MLHFLMKLIMAAISATALTGCGGDTEAYPETLTMEVLDVGQGLAVLFSQGERHALFDAGPDSAGIADSLCARGIQRLDWVLVSHWHRDHAGGLLDWSAGGPAVDTLFYGPDTAGAWIRDSVFALAHKHGTVGSIAERPREWRFGSWKFRILWPPDYEKFGENAASVVLQVTDGTFSALFPADLPGEEEAALLAYAPGLRADFLQAGHHGSATSSSLAFLASLAPTQAAISVGKGNVYGHPARSTLKKLAAVLGDSVQVHRTDTEGTLRWEWEYKKGIWFQASPEKPMRVWKCTTDGSDALTPKM